MRLAQMAKELNRPTNEVSASGRELLTNLGARHRSHLITHAWQVQIVTTNEVATWLR
ncbi:hypothetical protein [Streptomyces sp. NPDC058603]|uniref:hypothetical protein n=1 Tax=Streptomyces sp. NPDC058603 TaxID=3346551 RepID=UPI003656DD80